MFFEPRVEVVRRFVRHESPGVERQVPELNIAVHEYLFDPGVAVHGNELPGEIVDLALGVTKWRVCSTDAGDARLRWHDISEG